MSRLVFGVAKNYELSSSPVFSGSYPPSSAFDGVSNTYTNRWVSVNGSFTGGAANQPVWWQIKFDQPKTVTKIGFSISTSHIKTFRVLVSDTGAFAGEETDCGTISIIESNTTFTVENTDYYDIPTPTLGRYLRLDITEIEELGSNPYCTINEIYMFDDEISLMRMLITANNGAAQYVTVVELSCYTTVGGEADLCYGGLVTADSQANASNIASYAFDNNPVNKWTSSTTPPSEGSPHWIQYEFDSPVDIKSYSLQGCISGQEDVAPRDWQIQFSSDGIEWLTFDTQTNETGWVGGEVRTYDVSNNYIEGQTKINSIDSSCTLRIYNRDTGELVQSMSSESDGSYVFNGLDAEVDYDIVCIGTESVCPQISGPLSPIIGTPVDYIPEVTLDLKFNDPGSTVIIDNSPHYNDITTLGDTIQSDSVVHSGSGSLLLDGTGDYITVDNPTLFTTKGDFTVEAWIYRSSDNTRDVIASKYSAFATDGFTFQIRDNELGLAIGSGSYQNTSSTTLIPTGEWVHVAATKEGQTVRVFINGIKEGETITTGTPNDNSVSMTIGRDSVATDRDFHGYIDSLKWTHGVALYTDDFTPT